MTLEEILGELASRGMCVCIDTKHMSCGSDKASFHVRFDIPNFEFRPKAETWVNKPTEAAKWLEWRLREYEGKMV